MIQISNEEYEFLIRTSVKYEEIVSAYKTQDRWDFTKMVGIITGESSLEEIEERRAEFEKKMKETKKGAE